MLFVSATTTVSRPFDEAERIRKNADGLRASLEWHPMVVKHWPDARFGPCGDPVRE